MKLPQLYINVSQTIFATVFAAFGLRYIFNKEFRDDINSAIADAAGGTVIF